VILGAYIGLAEVHANSFFAIDDNAIIMAPFSDRVKIKLNHALAHPKIIMTK
jgi:hypothetical protein